MMIDDSLLSIIQLSVVTGSKMLCLFLFLFLRLLDEAVHDAGRDDDGGEDGLGHDNHCLVLHVVLLSGGTLLSQSSLSHGRPVSFHPSDSDLG